MESVDINVNESTKKEPSSDESLYTVNMMPSNSQPGLAFSVDSNVSSSVSASTFQSSVASQASSSFSLKPVAAVLEEQDQALQDRERVSTQRRNDQLRHVFIIMMYVAVFLFANWVLINWSYVEDHDKYVCRDSAFCHGNGVCYLKLKY